MKLSESLSFDVYNMHAKAGKWVFRAPECSLKRGVHWPHPVYKFYHFICRSLNICVFVRVCSDRNIMRVGSSDYRPACQTGNVRELLMFSDPPSWFWDHSLQAPLPIMMHKKIVLQGLSIQMSWSVGQVTTVCCSQVIFRLDEGKHSYIH